MIHLLLLLLFQTGEAKVWTSGKEPLSEMKHIRAQIKAPTFRNKDYLITNFGAMGDGNISNTEAIRKAILTCHEAGGGRVIVPQGKFLTGPIYLKSNVNLHLSEGATLIFSRNPKDYPLVLSRWEGMDCMNYSAQIYAYGEQNIAITGKGTLDGNADKKNWWPWKGRSQYGWKKGMPNQLAARAKLHEMMAKQIAAPQRIFGEGHYLRPYMLQPYNCKNILIEGVRMINSPMWFISPVMCENITIQKVHIESEGPNTDGCDPDACKNVLIKDCYFNTGDDCIAIKSGRDEDGRNNRRPAENHIIENCEMKNGHGGIVIGSEIAGGAKNIYAINCRMSSPNLDIVLRIKTSSSRGGIIENVFVKDIKVGRFKGTAVHCNMFYEKPGANIPVIRNVWVENLRADQGGEYGLFINAYKDSPVQNLKLINCDIKGVKHIAKVDHIRKLDLQGTRINGKLIKASDITRESTDVSH